MPQPPTLLRRGLRLAGAAVVVLLLAASALQLTADAGEAGASGCDRDRAHAATRAAAVTGQGRRVVVIGDSWSVGLGLADLTESWPSRLSGRVHVSGFSGSGFSLDARVCEGSAFAQRAPEAVAQGADLVVVQGGLNDHDQPAPETAAGFELLLQRLAGLPVVVVGPAAAPARAAAAHRVDELLDDLARRHRVPYVSTIGWELEYRRDGLHLTAVGHREFGDRVSAAIEALGRHGKPLSRHS